MNFPLASLARPPVRHPPVADFRLPSFGPPLHQHAHFRHRSAPVFATLRPSATVAAWHPGPTAPVRGKASIPPGVVSTGSGAAVRRDLPGFASACFHPCPENGPSQKVSAIFTGVNRPGFLRSRVGSRLCYSQLQQTAKRSSHRQKFLVAVAAEARSKRYFQLSGLWPDRLRRLTR